MISLSNLRTSQIERLAERLPEGHDLDGFLNAAKTFLSAFDTDGGADEDLLFVTGKRLSSHGIWNHVPAKKLRAALKDIPGRRIEVFLERAPEDYRLEVLSTDAEIPVAPQSETKSQDHRAMLRKRRAVTGVKKAYKPKSSPPNQVPDYKSVGLYAAHYLTNHLRQSTSVQAVDISVQNSLEALGIVHVGKREAHGPGLTLRLALQSERKIKKLMAAKEDEKRKSKHLSGDHR